MAAPLVHYSSHGSGGLVFDCWREAYEQHAASQDPTKPEAERWQHYTVPPPQTRTDLRKVTCPRCWAEIQKMASKHTQERA